MTRMTTWLELAMPGSTHPGSHAKGSRRGSPDLLAKSPHEDLTPVTPGLALDGGRKKKPEASVHGVWKHVMVWQTHHLSKPDPQSLKVCRKPVVLRCTHPEISLHIAFHSAPDD